MSVKHRGLVSFGHWIDLFVKFSYDSKRFIYLFAAPVQAVIFEQFNSTSHNNNNNIEHNDVIRQLTFVQGQPASLRCVIVGGYPPPDVTFVIDDTDFNGRLDISQNATLSAAGEKGLRRLLYRTEASADDVRFGPDDDGKLLRCVATVSGIGSLTAAVRILVNRKCMLHSSTSIIS